MIRKFLAILALMLVGFVGAAGAANAYEAPEIPEIDTPVDVSEIEPGEPVPFFMDEFLPGSSATLTVSADGVDGGDIGLSVLGSASINATVGPAGGFSVAVVFPEPAVYTISASGLNEDGSPRTVSMTLEVSPATSGGGDGDDGDGGNGGNGGGGQGQGGNGQGGGLPNTGFSSLSALLAGAGLAGLGAGVIFLSRRRSHELADSNA